LSFGFLGGEALDNGPDRAAFCGWGIAEALAGQISVLVAASGVDVVENGV